MGDTRVSVASISSTNWRVGSGCDRKKNISSLFESKCWQPLTLGGNYLSESCSHPTKIGNKREVDMHLLLNDYLENLSKLFRFYEYFLLSVFVETSLKGFHQFLLKRL